MMASGAEAAPRLTLDTSAYSHLRAGHEVVLDLASAADSIFVPATVLGELYGAFELGSRGQENLVALTEFLSEPFVTVVPTAPATKHVTGSNEVRLHIRLDERSGRIIAIGVEDNLVKGAAGQAVQAFNLVHGLPETAGLEQLPLAP